jgi:hypothetical protein
VPEGQRLKIAAQGREFDVLLPLAGDFQASNVLVAAGLVLATGEDLEATIAALEHLEGAAGRLQRVGAGARGGEAYVDYAHTPDGLETVLAALRPHTRGKLIVVFGAGGDRDRGKRPLMGEIAARLADVAIVTDDNPRSEVPPRSAPPSWPPRRARRSSATAARPSGPARPCWPTATSWWWPARATSRANWWRREPSVRRRDRDRPSPGGRPC